MASEPGERGRNLAEEPIQELELWDLVSAFGRIMRDYHVSTPSNIVYDETPIHVHMSRIHERLRSGGRIAFSDLFEPGMHKSALIGMFLAVLELIRHHGVRAEQAELHAEIWLLAGESTSPPLDPALVDNYQHGARHPRA
jgi:segregation and condensation protein A